MASQPKQQQEPPCLIKRTISVRVATTTDGYTVVANKHYTFSIESGTLRDAVQKGFIGTHDAMMARANKASEIAREIMESKRRKLDILPNVLQAGSAYASPVASPITHITPTTPSFIAKADAKLLPYIPEEDTDS
jgi:hypothetical protein